MTLSDYDLDEMQAAQTDARSDDWRAVMATRAGRNVLRQVLAHAGVFEGGFRASDFLQFESGRRDVGLMMLAAMMIADKGQAANVLINLSEREA